MCLVVALALAAAFWAATRHCVLLRDPLAQVATRSQKLWCCGVVAEEPRIRADGRRDFTLGARAVALPGRRPRTCAARLLVRVPRWVNQPIHSGDLVAVYGRVRAPTGPRNPGDFNYRSYLLARGIIATTYVHGKGDLRTLRKGFRPTVSSTVVAPVQRFVLRTLVTYLPLREAGLLQGLLLGRKELLNPEIRNAFAELGVIHVLAVSGLHVGYILLILTVVLGAVRVPGRWRWPMVLAGLALYVFLTGAKPPVVRASLMAAVFLLAESLQRRYDLFNGLGLAALVVLLWQPEQVAQVGFLLSFAAVASIALFYPRFRELLLRLAPNPGMGRWLLDLAAVSLAATFGTLPLTIVYFGRLPVFSLPANLVVVPLVGVAVALGIALVVAETVLPALAAPFATAAWSALWLVEHLATAAHKLGLHAIHTGHVPFVVVLIAWLAMLGLVFAHQRWGRVLAGLCTLLLLNALVWKNVLFAPPDLQVIFLDVGLGDAALLRSGDGHALLIDTGECSAHYDAATRVILPYLERQRIRRLDAVLISHGHQDHVGGLPAILRHVRVGRVFWNGVQSSAPGWVVGARVADSLGVPLKVLRAGDTLAVLGRNPLVVLAPDSAFAVARGPDDLNDASLVVLVRSGRAALLFTGDAERAEEERLLRYGRLLRADVLKVAHHGSATSTSLAFARAVSPELAVISVSHGNRFEFPAEKVVTRLRTRGARVLETGRTGAVVVRVREGRVRLVPWRRRPALGECGRAFPEAMLLQPHFPVESQDPR